MACVYWIHRNNQTDMFAEGYIGLTSRKLFRRFERHLHNAKNNRNICPKLERAIKKYGKNGLMFDELVRGSTEYCAEMEEKLRPHKDIGWNLWSGGNKGILGFRQSQAVKDKVNAKKYGRPVSPETRAKIATALKGNKCAAGSIRTPEMKTAQSERHTGYRHTDEAKNKIGIASRLRKGAIRSSECRERIRLGKLAALERKKEAAQ